MDIYRYFHPHHNPRLHRKGPRQQELSELEQAAAELLKASERMMQRCERNPVPPIFPQHFIELLKALRFVVRCYQILCDGHPGDSPEELAEIAQERSQFSGWETWNALVREQLGGKLPLAAANANAADEETPYRRFGQQAKS